MTSTRHMCHTNFRTIGLTAWTIILLAIWTQGHCGQLNPSLLALTPNRWVQLDTTSVEKWSRQAHAGMAYDSKRGHLVIFGSNTHGLDWDNSVHEFDPVTARWTTHYPEAPSSSYRADELGRAIAGQGARQPWAMHTYGGVTYDQERDGLLVVARPDHNPIVKKVPDARIQPTWFYDLARREWRMLPDSPETPANFFAAAAAYDERRKVAVAYRWGIWELMGKGGADAAWVRVSKESHHQMHYSLVYDSRRGTFAAFGDYQNSNEIWIYAPGARPGEAGSWTRHIPAGDPVPPSQAFPVAFDRDQSVFLLLPGNTEFATLPNGRQQARRAKSNSTFVYDPDADRYTRLPEADLPPLGMNFMLAYDPPHKVFLLVTGGQSDPPAVWALKLNLARLKR
jgi:hypothetical protein